MKKSYILIGAIICALLLPVQAGAATIMNTPDVAETPLGEDVTQRVPMSPVVTTPQEVGEAPAALTTVDTLHTSAGDHTDWSVLSAAGTLTTSGSYYLTGNVTGNLVIDAGVSVDLCLSGHTLNAGGAGSVIVVNSGATLRLCDCQGGGKVTGGKGVGGGVNVNEGTLEFYGGSITGNQAVRRGEAASGGGVYISRGTFCMYGGSIDHNQANRGGGVYVTGDSIFTMTGGEIANNTATGQGGGVYASKSADTTAYKLSGAPAIADNTAGSQANNLYLAGGGYISVPAPLAAEANVGVSVETPGVFAVPRNALSADGYRGNFSSDSADYGIGVNAENRLIVNVPVSVNYIRPTGVTGDVPASQRCVAGETVTVDTEKVMVATGKPGYRFAGWTNNVAGAKAMDTVTVVADTDLYPVFYTGFEDSGVSTVLKLTYGDAVNIDLNSYVQAVDAGAGTKFRFASAEELPLGLKLVNDAGEEAGVRHILSGDLLATPGEYEMKFTVTQIGGATTLFSLTETPSFGVGELKLDLRVDKMRLSTNDFVFTPPENAVSDGTVKSATVVPANNRISAGIGEIEVKYSPADPTAIGVYRVSIDVKEGSRYQAISGLYGDDWTFAIRLGTPALEAVTYNPTQTLADVALPAGWSWVEPTAVPTVVNSGYRAVYTIPSGGDYDWAKEEGYQTNGTVIRTVPLTVNKATPSYEVPTGLAATQGQTLGQVQLPDGWTWDSDVTTKVGEPGVNTFKAAYTPPDSENYRTVRRVDVQITVSAGTQAVGVTLGTPRVSGTTTTIPLSVTPVDLLNGAQVIAGRYENGAMTDLAWGVLEGDTVVFRDKRVNVSGWKVFFLDGSRYAPLCEVAEVR